MAWLAVILRVLASPARLMSGALPALRWLKLSRKMKLTDEESHLFQCDAFCEPLGPRGVRHRRGSLGLIFGIVSSSPFLNPEYKEKGKQPEFDFINLDPDTLGCIRDGLTGMETAYNGRTRKRTRGARNAQRKLRGAWLILSTLCAAMVSDKSWGRVQDGSMPSYGPARLLFYRRGARNAPHPDSKSGGRLLLTMANNPLK